MIKLSFDDYKIHCRPERNDYVGFIIYSLIINDSESFGYLEIPVIIFHGCKEIYKDRESLDNFVSKKFSTFAKLCKLTYDDEETDFVAEKYFEFLL